MAKAKRSAPASTPKALIRAFVREAKTENRGRSIDTLMVEWYPSGLKILGLDKIDKAQAALALYQAIPLCRDERHGNASVQLVLLVQLSMKLFRGDLPIPDADLVTMLQCTLQTHDPRYSGGLERNLAQFLARRPQLPTAKMKAGLRKIIAKRSRKGYGGGGSAAATRDRKICDACAKLL
jgi:hypothetical protein